MPTAPSTLAPLALSLVTDSPVTGPTTIALDAPTVQGEGQIAAPPGQGPGEGGGEGSSQGAGQGSPMMAWLPFIVIGVVFWMLIIGPERRNRKKREEMLGALSKGDKVMTTGGLYGRIAEVREDVVILDTGDVRLKYSRSAIQGVVGQEDSK